MTQNSDSDDAAGGAGLSSNTVPFGLHPIEALKAKGHAYHDYSTKVGLMIYQNGCKPFNGENKVALDAKGLAMLKPFILAVSHLASHFLSRY